MLTKLIPDKNGINTGITTDKAALKRNIAGTLGLICQKTYSFALLNNNAPLAAQVNTRPDKIFKTRDADLLGYVTELQNIITPLLNDPNYIKYGVTAAQLDDIANNAATFNSMIGKADVANSSNAVANAAIDKAITLLRLNIKHMDLLVDEFAKDDAGFVQAYHINSQLDNTGIRHSGIEGYVRATKDGGALPGATITLQNTTKVAVTDLKGFYHIDRAEPGDYMVLCSADGYATQTKPYHISRGKTDELDWEMVAG